MSQDVDTRPITDAPSPATLPPVSLRLPYLSCTILAGLCLVFAAEQIFAVTPPKGLWDVSVSTLDAMGGLSRDAVVRDGEWYRLFSATLLHGDLMHIVFNGIALIFVGMILEHIIGRAWFGASYVISGLAGALLSCLLIKPQVVSIGASGAITGLFATLWMVSYLYAGEERQRMQTNAARLLAPAILPVLWKASSGIDYWGHIGGALGGAGVGFFLLKNWARAVEPRLKSVATTISIAGLVLAVATAIPIAQGYHQRADLTPYVRRGEMHLLNQDYERAFQDFDEAVRHGPKNASAYFTRGRARLHVAAYKLAAEDFRKALETSPVTAKNYAYYALWMYLAQMGARESAKAELTSNARKLPIAKWPYPVIDFYLGNITVPTLLTASPDDEKRCEADFYLAQLLLLGDEKEAAIPLLQAAKNKCPKTFIEYTAAVLELRKLGL